MPADRITELRISGLRVIRELTLPLSGLTVLIGDNGTGKSSILEALEILRQAAKPLNLVTDVLAKGHGGFQALLRRGADKLELGVTVEGAGPRIDYDFAVANIGNTPAVVSESVQVHEPGSDAPPLRPLARTQGKLQVLVTSDRYPNSYLEAAVSPVVVEHALALPQVGLPHLGSRIHPAIRRLIEALGHLEVQVPFEARPLWQAKEQDLRTGPRWPTPIEGTDRLARYAANLPNAYQQLRNSGEAVWRRVLERARLGLGADLREFSLSPSGRGSIELELLFGAFPDRPLPLEVLSEGQVCYLAFIALRELHPERSLLAFDEPENHLHPALLARVVWMLEEVAQTAPVILATHSDRLLDALTEPAGSVVLCELDEQRASRLRLPSKAQLEDWLRDYQGLGSLRAEGYEAHVFVDDAPSGRGKAP